MDAYIFACEASSAAVDDVLALVGTVVRVACPLIGDRALYAAVSDNAPLDLFGKISTVASVGGLSGVSTLLRTGTSTLGFPTYGVVFEYVGFSFVVTEPGQLSTAFTAVQSITDMIGAATVVAGTTRILAESSADDSDDVSAAMDAIDDLGSVTSSQRAIGLTSLGAGWPT